MIISQAQVPVRCADARNLVGRWFAPDKPRAAVVIASALGVTARFYDEFATWLAERGYAVLSFDYRGVAASEDAAVGPVTMDEWGRLDLEAALAEASRRVGGAPLFLVGHSCGGQLAGLAGASARLSGILMVGATLAWWRRWPFPANVGLLTVWWLPVPALAVGRKRFPAPALRLSPVTLPAARMRQWARWARRPDYLFDPRFGLDRSGYGEIRCPLLSYSFDDDGYASRESVAALPEKFPWAAAEHRHVQSAALGIGHVGHFGFFRRKAAGSLWTEVLAWLDAGPRPGSESGPRRSKAP